MKMTNTPNFSKSKYCGLWQCPKIAWLRKYKPEEQKIGDDVLERMAEHIYMYSSENTQVKFRVKKYLINDVMDWFGNDVKITDAPATKPPPA